MAETTTEQRRNARVILDRLKKRYPQISTALDYACGALVHRAQDPARRKAWAWASVAGNLLLLGLLAVPALAQPTGPAGPLRFKLTFPSTLQAEPFNGRVYVILTTQLNQEPRLSQSWFNPPHILAVDAADQIARQDSVFIDAELGAEVSIQFP